MKRLSRFVFAVAVLILGALAVQPARADSIDDPSIEAGVIAALPSPLPTGATTATETLFTWTDSYNTLAGTNYLAFYLNDTGTTWTDMTIIATEGGSTTASHTFTNETFSSSLFPTGTTAAFTTVSPASLGTADGGVPITFADSGGTGVAPGDYLVIRYNNWATSNPDSTFSFTMSTAASEAAPEPSSFVLLAIGLLALFGLAGFAKCRKAGIAVA